MTTAIEWTNETWNPVTGRTEVSEGCDHCYARTITERFGGKGAFDTIVLHPDRLDKPLHWRKPRRVFVNSMSDLFHDDVPDEFIEQVFIVMARTPWHTYQVLTKRPGRMASLLNRPDVGRTFIVNHAASELSAARLAPFDGGSHVPPWPLPNVWLGTSVENQRWTDIRVPKLLETPAAVRFLSCEPLLGPIDLTRGDPGGGWIPPAELDEGQPAYPTVQWVICGGESGRGHREMDVAWAQSLADQCAEAEVAFFMKQDSGPRPGRQGRLPDELWSRKEFPVNQTEETTP